MAAILSQNGDPLVNVQSLVKHFPTDEGPIRAVDSVTFDIFRGETLGLVGESGCGKSTTGRCILRLIEPTSGDVKFESRDVTAMNKRDLRALAARDADHLSGSRRVTKSAHEGRRHHRRAPGDSNIGRQSMSGASASPGCSAKSASMPDYASRYSHEFSGGQLQRIGVARALALNPKLIVADEPVSALDVSVQAQVVNLLQDLQKEFGLTYLFISHGLAVVEHISTRVAVMYLGRDRRDCDGRSALRRPFAPVHGRAVVGDSGSRSERETRSDYFERRRADGS